jgi:hypothetical protein
VAAVPDSAGPTAHLLRLPEGIGAVTQEEPDQDAAKLNSANKQWWDSRAWESVMLAVHSKRQMTCLLAQLRTLKQPGQKLLLHHYPQALMLLPALL